MKPLFTIGIASYNYASYIGKGLNAIKNQKFKDYEIVISDDCSTDNSVQVIKKFMNDNPELRIRLIENDKNKGIVANKNKIIENCNGQYLLLCDADDWMSEDCLEKAADIIMKEKPDRVLTEVAHIDENNNIIQIEHLPKNQTKWGWNIHHGCFNKTSIIKEFGIKIEGVPDDVYFSIEFTKHCKKVSIINEVMYYWLVHLNSAGRKKIGKVTDEMIDNVHGKLLYYLGDTIQFIESSNDINKNKDKEELRLVLLKMYYFRLLFSFQRFCLRDKLKYYIKLKKIMLSIDKDYLQNQYLSRKINPPLRAYAMNAIKLCVRLEKLHLMSPALIAYHIMGKFKYFDQ